jgi:DnaJ-class molecular chaperone
MSNNPTNASQTYYEVLGVAANASLQQIESAYRQLALQCHPDKQKADSNQEAAVRFHQLGIIKTTLCDSTKRKQYDLAPIRILNAGIQAQNERVSKFLDKFKWDQVSGTEFQLKQIATGTTAMSLSKNALNELSLPISDCRGDGVKLPVRIVIKKKLQFLLQRYVEDNLIDLECGLEK